MKASGTIVNTGFGSRRETKDVPAAERARARESGSGEQERDRKREVGKEDTTGWRQSTRL
jgi:hypothetical protein